MLHSQIAPDLGQIVRSVPLNKLHDAINLCVARMQHSTEELLRADLAEDIGEHVWAIDDHAAAITKTLNAALFDANLREVFA